MSEVLNVMKKKRQNLIFKLDFENLTMSQLALYVLYPTQNWFSRAVN